MSFFQELKRRSVFRAGAAYAVTAWLVIQVVETILPAFGFGDAALRIVTIAFAIGLIPVLLIAWFFERTPEGIRHEGDIDRSEDAPRSNTRTVDGLIIAILCVALTYFAIDKFVLEPRREALVAADRAQSHGAVEPGAANASQASLREKSIAVLAFADMSPDQDQGYLSDGVAEEILNLLAQIHDLRVIARSSSFSYKDKSVKLSDVARELNVAHVLEGSVRTSDDRVRVTAQLIEAFSDRHLWSQTYDRKLEDIFAIQEEIAADVVQELAVKLRGAVPRARKTDPEAYGLYLRASQLGERFTPEALTESDALLQRVIEIDPSYVPAWNALAINTINQAGMGVMSGGQANEIARKYSEHALQIDPDYGSAHALLGWIARRENDLPGAAAHYQRALDLEPANVNSLNGSAVLLTALGRVEDALALQEAVVARNPLNETGRSNLGITLYRVGRLDEAIATFESVRAQNPERNITDYSIGAARLLQGDAAAALKSFLQEPSEIWRLLGLPMAYHALGRKAESDAALEVLVHKYGDKAAYNIAYVHAFRGEADLAFQWLERELELTGPAMPTIVAEPLFGNIHSDPRWAEFLSRIGKGPAQLAAIEFKVAAPRR